MLGQRKTDEEDSDRATFANPESPSERPMIQRKLVYFAYPIGQML